MNVNVKKRYCENLHTPKNANLVFEKPKIIEDNVSQKYFETAFRIDPVDGHLISDIEVLNDSSTPAILKDYILQHSATVIKPESGVPSSMVDKIDPFDLIVNKSAQTVSELVSDYKQKGVDISVNKLD